VPWGSIDGVVPDSYRTLLRTPVVGRALSTLLVARLLGPMAGLAVVLLTVSRTGSFAAAGLVSGVWVGVSGVGTLFWSRLVDRGRPRRVLVGTAVGSSAGLLALALVPTSSVPALIGLTALAAAASPPVIPTGRALWPVLLADEPSRSAMYSLEATLQELTFIVGPALAGAVAAAAGPAASVLVAAGLSLAGCAAFASTPGLDRVGHRDAARARGPDLLALSPLLVTGGLLICGLSMSEVAVIGTASRAGSANLSGLLLAVWSAGSLVGGLLGGARPARRGSVRRLLRLLPAVALTTFVLAPIHILPLVGAVLVLGGGLVAPTLGALYTLVQQRAPAGAVTQTFAALTLSAYVGAAAGASAAGSLVQVAGPGMAFLVAGLLPVAAAVLVGGTVARATAPARREATADASG
jgi:predicted MFS family arabinose efflux permease